MGLLGDIGTFIGETIGTVAGIAVAPISIALGVSQAAVKRAIEAGCRTEREIKRWIDDNE